MITVEVSLLLTDIEKVVETEETIHLWLLDNIGDLALSRDHVGEDSPWYVTRRWAENIYHFAREQDAVLFKLRWV